jgi:hypothetical protein
VAGVVASTVVGNGVSGVLLGLPQATANAAATVAAAIQSFLTYSPP